MKTNRIDNWRLDEQGRVIAVRKAEFWSREKGRQISCQLCYRRCVLEDGQPGWCRTRTNAGGKMRLAAHGQLSCLILQQRGYQVDPFMTYKPGARSLFVGGVGCTSGCVFCMSKEITWAPEKVPWAHGEGQPAQGRFYANRAMVHPLAVIRLAQTCGCTQIEFGINEPTLTIEYTLDLAALAKEAGLDVLIETNGFTSPAVIRQLAPLVDAVDLGVKGSLDPQFYSRWMRAPGAVDAVKQSAIEWRKAGVHLIVGDVIAPPRLQPDPAFAAAVESFYTWVYQNLGELAEVLITAMMIPGPAASSKDGFFLPARASDADVVNYSRRITWAIDQAQTIGLPYAHNKTAMVPIICHNCGGELLAWKPPTVYCHPCLMPMQYCDRWGHEQHVTAGHCDHCGAAVPVATLSPAELEAVREGIRNFPADLRYQGPVTYSPA